MAATTGFKSNRSPRVLVNTLNQAPDATNTARVGDMWLQCNLGAGPPGNAIMFICSSENPTVWSQVP